MAICKVKKWGNSMGIIIPREIIQMEKIRVNQEIEVLIMKKDNTLKESFGMLKGKLKKTAQQMKDEARKELYDE